MNDEADKPRYGLRDALYMSFYSREFYLDVEKRWRGRTIALGFLICALLAVDFGARTLIGFSRNLIHDADIAAKSLPDIEAKNGRIEGQTTAPVVVKDPANDSNLMVVDLSGSLKTVGEAKSKYLLTSEMLYVKDDEEKDGAGQQEWPVNTFQVDWKVRPTELPGLARQFAYGITALIVFAIMAVMPTILFLNAALISGIVKACRSPRTFWESVRLCVASVVPAVVVGLLLDPILALVGVPEALADNFTRVVGLVYLIYAFKITRPMAAAEAKIAR
ncbi:MAG: DUF1189 domain-containing protein [Candidatus Obscuribacterales bacterium]|nr:DUF1189 domain-containing protein [Candidatus Obscuribacterales bacterium]